MDSESIEGQERRKERYMRREEEMSSDSIVLKLTPEDALRLTRILIDEDQEEALLFLKECLKPQLDQATRGRLIRSFEAP